MSTAKKITMNIPEELMESAQRVTGRGITQTIKLALELLSKRESYSKMLALKGSYQSKMDLKKLRED